MDASMQLWKTETDSAQWSRRPWLFHTAELTHLKNIHSAVTISQKMCGLMDSGVQKVASAVNYESCREQGEQRERERGGGVFWESEEVACCNVRLDEMRPRP